MLNIEIHSGFKTIMWIVGVFTCGVGAVGLWWQTRSWPRVMDADGITLRNGTRVRWADCTRVIQVTAVDGQGGGRMSGRADLEFGRVRVRLVPQSVVQGEAMLEFASERLGQRVISG